MAVIWISGMSTWRLSWANAMKFLFMVADSSMVWSAGNLKMMSVGSGHSGRRS